MPHSLEVLDGGELKERYDLSREEILIGRGPACHVVLESRAVSRVHARLAREGDTYTIEDLRSRSGTYVNGKPVTVEMRLGDGDRIKIADDVFVFRCSRLDVSENRDDAGRSIVLCVDARRNADSTPQVDAEARLEAVLKITRALGRTLDLEAVLSQMLEGLFDIFPRADRGLVLLLDGDRLVPRAVKQRDDGRESIQYSRTVVRQAMDRRQAILSEDAVVDGRFTHAESIAAFQIRSIMCVPLLSQEMDALGVIQLVTQSEGASFTADDVSLLTSVASQASISVEYAQLHKERLKQARLEREMDIAQDVQRNFLPQATPGLAGYEFWAYYLAAGKVGGDYYDFLRLPDGRQAVLLGDVSGKGVPAALMMAKASAVCKVALLNRPDDIGLAVGEMNNEICAMSAGANFLTLTISVIDAATHQVTRANAGHMSPMFRRADGTVHEPSDDDVRGYPLGIARDYQYKTTSTVLAPGEAVVLYSDGISEAEDARDDLYSVERVKEQLGRIEGKTAAEIGEALLEDVRRHTAGCQQSDDVSLVVFRRVEG